WPDIGAYTIGVHALCFCDLGSVHRIFDKGRKWYFARFEVKCYLCVFCCLSRFQKCDCITWKMGERKIKECQRSKCQVKYNVLLGGAAM
ncbi:hypothetical protein A2U01_0020671, partial [Trifolium medium]|nr:hypothetical protein [Trifolium medium]